MCTAINLTEGRHVFGRTLDLEFSFGEKVVITPRKFPLHFLHKPTLSEHCAIIGTAHISGGTPLYYDAVNELGLCSAALNFPRYAKYNKRKSGAHNVASFELIPWILSRAESVSQAMRLLSGVNVTDESYSDELPATELHWIFADKYSAVTVEATENGLKMHENPYGVMTNSPDFSYQITHLESYTRILREPGACNDFPEIFHSKGVLDFGIPGDFSSSSRFVKTVFVKSRTESPKTKEGAISRLFHILGSVSQPRGVTSGPDGRPVATVYTSAIDTQESKYYFTTYQNRRIRCVKLNTPSALGENLVAYSMLGGEDVAELN